MKHWPFHVVKMSWRGLINPSLCRLVQLRIQEMNMAARFITSLERVAIVTVIESMGNYCWFWPNDNYIQWTEMSNNNYFVKKRMPPSATPYILQTTTKNDQRRRIREFMKLLSGGYGLLSNSFIPHVISRFAQTHIRLLGLQTDSMFTITDEKQVQKLCSPTGYHMKYVLEWVIYDCEVVKLICFHRHLTSTWPSI